MSRTLFAVVGPSGAGKDTLIRRARDVLEGDLRFVFPRRFITRPEEAGGENHIAVAPETFAEMKRTGAFVLDWEAHGLAYGIPGDAADMARAGRHVVVNLSRSVVARARESFPEVHVVHITAPPDLIAMRLAARDREHAEDIRTRLERASQFDPGDGPTSTICNDGDLADAEQAFLDVLTGTAG